MNNNLESLLQPNEPPSYRIINPDSKTSLLITVPHAGGITPEKLGTMGFNKDEYEKICKKYPFGDLGIIQLAEELAECTGAFTILSNYHRRVVDLNRPRNDRAFQNRGETAPANINMSAQEKERRFQEIYDPFHQAIENRIKERPPAMLLDIHSFHAHIGGDKYDFGLLFHDEQGKKIAENFARFFAVKNSNLAIGYNEPYDLTDPYIQEGTIIYRHKNIPGLSPEIRNDQINTAEKEEIWARMIYECLKENYPQILEKI